MPLQAYPRRPVRQYEVLAPSVQGKIKSLEQIYLFSMPVKEYQIVENFLGSALKDEVMKIMPVQKQTRAGQRTRFKAFVVVGDHAGHVGLGVKCAKEVSQSAWAVSCVWCPPSAKARMHVQSKEIDTQEQQAILLSPAMKTWLLLLRLLLGVLNCNLAGKVLRRLGSL